MKSILVAITRSLILIVILVLPGCAPKTLDHFRFYSLQLYTTVPLPDTMKLVGQLDPPDAEPLIFKIANLDYFGVPVLKDPKNGEKLKDENDHLSWYDFVNPGVEKAAWKVKVTNQFTNNKVIEFKLDNMPRAVLVPTWKKKGNLVLPTELSHYKLYRITDQISANRNVNLIDQFLSNNEQVLVATYFGVPVRKKARGEWESIKSKQHLTIYKLEEKNATNRAEFKIKNQFEDNRGYKADKTMYLAVPTEKIGKPTRLPPPND